MRFGSTGVPCDHGEEHGCAGYLLTVYKGPKAWIPESCYQPCSCVREGRGERAGAASQDRGSPGYLEPEAAPEAFPALLNLSEASLRELEASVVLVDDFLLKEAPVVAQADARIRELRVENRHLAEDLRVASEDLRGLAEAQRSRGEASRGRLAEVQALSARRDLVLRARAPDRLATALQEAADVAEHEAEELTAAALEEAAPALCEDSLADFRRAFLAKKAEKHRLLALSARTLAEGL